MALRKIKVHIDNWDVTWGVSNVLDVAHYSSGTLYNNMRVNWAIDGSGYLLNGSGIQVQFKNGSDQGPVKVLAFAGDTTPRNLSTLNSGIALIGSQNASASRATVSGGSIVISNLTHKFGFFYATIEDQMKPGGFFELYITGNGVNFEKNPGAIATVGARYSYGGSIAVPGSNKNVSICGFLFLQASTGKLITRGVSGLVTPAPTAVYNANGSIQMFGLAGFISGIVSNSYIFGAIGRSNTKLTDGQLMSFVLQPGPSGSEVMKINSQRIFALKMGVGYVVMEYRDGSNNIIAYPAAGTAAMTTNDPQSIIKIGMDYSDLVVTPVYLAAGFVHSGTDSGGDDNSTNFPSTSYGTINITDLY